MSSGAGADVADVTDRAGGDGAARTAIGLALAELEEQLTYEEASRSTIAEVVHAAESLGDRLLMWRARLLQADFDGKSGQLAAAMRQSWRVNEYAAKHGHALLLARSHLVLAWTHRDVGDFASYLHHSVLAVEALDQQTPDSVRGLHVFRLAIALDECGSAEQASIRYDQAEEYAIAAGDAVKQIGCLNNRAYGEYQRGDLVGAAATAHRLAEVSRAGGLTLSPHILDTLARIQLAEGRREAALTSIGDAIRRFHEGKTQNATAPAEFLLTRSMIQRHLEQYEDAWTSLKECRLLASEADLRSVLCRVEEEEAALHAATGNFQTALHHFKAYHSAQKLLLSDQRAAQAHLRQEMLQIAEVRASAEHFYQEANRDHLSGLPNRRYLDNTLPTLLLHRQVGEVMALALVDVDQFKQINDEYSHAMGDSVIVEVAHLLDEASVSVSLGEAHGFAARLGGDEFAVVLRGSSTTKMQDCIESLRRSVAERVWPDLPADLRVSISVGLTWATEEDTQSTLLQRADVLLYRAKQAGRNQICSDRHASSPSSTV